MCLVGCMTSDGLRTNLGYICSPVDAKLNQLFDPSGTDFCALSSLLVLRFSNYPSQPPLQPGGGYGTRPGHKWKSQMRLPGEFLKQEQTC